VKTHVPVPPQARFRSGDNAPEKGDRRQDQGPHDEPACQHRPEDQADREHPSPLREPATCHADMCVAAALAVCAAGHAHMRSHAFGFSPAAGSLMLTTISWPAATAGEAIDVDGNAGSEPRTRRVKHFCHSRYQRVKHFVLSRYSTEVMGMSSWDPPLLRRMGHSFGGASPPACVRALFSHSCRAWTGSPRNHIDFRHFPQGALTLCSALPCSPARTLTCLLRADVLLPP